MKITISDALLSKFSEYLAAQTGLNFPRKRWRDLERGVISAALDFGFGDAESCIHWLMSSSLTKDRIEILANHLTIGETYFFREKQVFKILEEDIIPKLLRSRRGIRQHLRIWSAGCSTGEEPYSIAILLSKIIPDLKDWNVTILATDINAHFLQKAAEGVYGDWSFRDTPCWVKEKYFRCTKEGRFEILSDIKKMVTFSYLNLAEDVYPSFLNNTGMMDVIFCRNVLIYFTPEHKKKVVQSLYRSLVDGGWLVVSPSETSILLFSKFVAVNFTGAILHKKDQQKTLIEQDLKAMVSFSTPAEAGVDTCPKFQGFSNGQTGFFKESTAQNLFAGYEQPPVPEPRQTPYEEALVLYGQGRYEEAAEKLAGLLLDNSPMRKEIPSRGQVMALLARIYANQGKLAQSLEWCEKAVAADKLNPGFHYLLATILQEQGQVEEAMMSLKRALYLDPNFVIAHFALGNLVRQQGGVKESDKHFENARLLLRRFGQEDILPESDGITTGRLEEIIAHMIVGRN